MLRVSLRINKATTRKFQFEIERFVCIIIELFWIAVDIVLLLTAKHICVDAIGGNIVMVSIGRAYTCATRVDALSIDCSRL